jgi:hypothetical protein
VAVGKRTETRTLKLDTEKKDDMILFRRPTERKGTERVRRAITLNLLILLLFGAGCSLVSDFGDYKFGNADSGFAGDGEITGEGGNSAESGAGGSGTGGSTVGGSGTGGSTKPTGIRHPSSVWQSNGGGKTSSANYQIQVTIGVPQPMGVVTSKQYKITIGPWIGSQ